MLFLYVFYFFGKLYKILTILILMLNLDQCALENESNAWRAVSGASPEDNSLYFGIFFSRDSAMLIL